LGWRTCGLRGCAVLDLHTHYHESDDDDLSGVHERDRLIRKCPAPDIGKKATFLGLGVDGSAKNLLDFVIAQA
jgi:hypothetical protein